MGAHPPPPRRPSQRLCFSLSHSLRNAPSPPPATVAPTSSCGPLGLRLPLPLFHCTCKLTLCRCPLSQPGAAAEHPGCPPASFCAALGVHPLSVPAFPTVDQAVASRPDRGPAGLWEGRSLFWFLEPWYRVQSGVSVGCPGTQPAALRAVSGAPGYQPWAWGICAAAAPGEGICLSWSQWVVA